MQFSGATAFTTRLKKKKRLGHKSNKLSSSLEQREEQVVVIVGKEHSVYTSVKNEI